MDPVMRRIKHQETGELTRPQPIIPVGIKPPELLLSPSDAFRETIDAWQPLEELAFLRQLVGEMPPEEVENDELAFHVDRTMPLELANAIVLLVRQAEDRFREAEQWVALNRPAIPAMTVGGTVSS